MELRWVLRVAMCVLAGALLATACASSGSPASDEVAMPDTNETATAEMPSAPVARVAPEPTTGPPPPALVDYYLPQWLPDGYQLEQIRTLDGPEELRLPEHVAGDMVVLGDSIVLSDTSVMITARRFGTAEDLEHAVYIEDALMVQIGGPDSILAVEGASYAYQQFGAPGENSEGAQFHAVLDDTLVTGLIFGEIDEGAYTELVSSILVDDDAKISVAADELGLVELARMDPSEGQQAGYELTYASGGNRFLVGLNPNWDEATIAMGSISRTGELLEGDVGFGFLEAQPEVGGALGSRRLVWWVPMTRAQIWFGEILTDDEAIRVADSVESVTESEWNEATDGIAITEIDFGPINLPENPRETFDELRAEQAGVPDPARRPEIDVADVLAFVGEVRDGELPGDATLEWLGPIEADLATSGMQPFPTALTHVLQAFGTLWMSEQPAVWGERRREDVRGLCCSVRGIQLVEGLEPGEAAVIAAHEFTHLYDTAVIDARYTSTAELVDATIALREGNANRVMIAYRDARSIQFNPESRPYLQLDMPIAIRRVLQFAYADGQRFAEALAASGGEAAIDDAFVSTPPLSTEHILHPDRYLAGDEPEPVDPPSKPDVEVEHQATLGAFVVALLAEDELGWDGAVDLVAAWAGDAFIAWTDGTRRCAAATVKFDDAASAATLGTIFGASSDGPAVTIERCSS